jgi:hypothetical protein
MAKSSDGAQDRGQKLEVELTDLELAALDVYRSRGSMARHLSRPQAAGQLLSLALKAQARRPAQEGGIPVDRLNAANDG